MSIKQVLASSVLIAASLLTSPVFAGDPVIVLDGASSEWSRVLTLADRGTQAQAANTLKALVTGGKLNIVVEGSQIDTKYNLFINKGGLPGGAWGSGSAEFLLTGDTGFNNLHSSTGAGWSWSAPIASSGIQVSANRYVMEFSIPLATMGITGAVPKFKIGFQSLSPAWATTAQLPVNASYAELVTPFAIGKGMIIPAYFSVTAPYTPPGSTPVPDPWNILKEGAIQVKNSTNPNYKDFFVVVNSGTNGPFAPGSADWATAATRWDPIRTNGGRVFGYVHTCNSVQQPDYTFVVGPAFRSLETVKAEITAWVNGYPGLDGIWLDEYNPRFEIATTTGTQPTFPNGLALAPTNRNFVATNGDFIYTEVEPAGGYYDQLTTWIRKTYPQLRIIGNAGGDLYSNQHYYAGLVDVLVSFEQTLAYAQAPSWQQPTVEWSKLNIFQATDPRDNALGRASIIHSNTTDLQSAINQPLWHGYSHVYTTNLALDSQLVGGWGTGPWGNMPPYLWSEIDYLVNR